ncbi:hypothetical protein D3C73_1388890 [compost metagenome]
MVISSTLTLKEGVPSTRVVSKLSKIPVSVSICITKLSAFDFMDLSIVPLIIVESLPRIVV